jgi:hypothetical protein
VTTFTDASLPPELAAAFPTIIPDVEAYVLEYVKAATATGLASGLPALSFYADRARAASEGRKIPVIAGWPTYPGQVPQIGVAAGPEGADQQHQTMAGEFAGDVFGYAPVTFPADGSGLKFDVDGFGIALQSTTVIGTASYYAEALSSTVLVQLIHENRDERDRLHDELRRVLVPIRRWLLARDGLIRKVSVEAEKTEYSDGPPLSEAPFVVYISLFTVQLQYEMLEATDVRGADSVLGKIDVAVTGYEA